MQVNHLAASVQVFAIGLTQHCAATRGQHADVVLGQFVDDGLFDIAKTRFALTFKKYPDRTAKTLFDQVVGVLKGPAQPAGQLPAYGGFAGAGEADKG